MNYNGREETKYKRQQSKGTTEQIRTTNKNERKQHGKHIKHEKHAEQYKQ